MGEKCGSTGVSLTCCEVKASSKFETSAGKKVLGENGGVSPQASTTPLKTRGLFLWFLGGDVTHQIASMT